MSDYIMALLFCQEMKYMDSYCPLNWSCIFPQNLWIISKVQYIWFLYLISKAGRQKQTHCFKKNCCLKYSNFINWWYSQDRRKCIFLDECICFTFQIKINLLILSNCFIWISSSLICYLCVGSDSQTSVSSSQKENNDSSNSHFNHEKKIINVSLFIMQCYKKQRTLPGKIN